MTDLELLFLVLGLLYVWECACWVRRGSVAFRTWVGKWWRTAHPSALLGNAKGGFVFNHLLPPLGTLVLAHQLPLSISGEALLAFVSPSLNPGWRPAQSGKSIRWEQVGTVQANGKELRVNGELLLKAATPGLAGHLAKVLSQLEKVSPGERAKSLEQLLRESLDARAVRERWNDFRQASRGVQWWGNILFGYLFVVTPAVIWFLGFSRTWPVLLAGLLVCTVTTALLFRRVHARFYPEAEDERFTHFLIVLLSPVSAIRAYDLLSRPALETFHPLAVAHVLCTEPQFRSFSRHLLREVRYPAFPLCPESDPVAQKAEAFWRGIVRGELEKFLKRHGFSLPELLQPPVPTEPNCLTYCPRCHAQFTADSGMCEDCGGVPLLAFGESTQGRRPAESGQTLTGAGAEPHRQE